LPPRKGKYHTRSFDVFFCCSESKIPIFCEQPPVHSGCVYTRVFVLASAIIPVPETFDRREGMTARTEDSARPDLLEINGFVRVFIIRQVMGQNDVGYIDPFQFLSIQPFRDSHVSIFFISRCNPLSPGITRYLARYRYNSNELHNDKSS
jgi:hypothetical protein